MIINVLNVWKKKIQYLHIQIYYQNSFIIIWYFNILPVWLNDGILEIEVRASFSKNKALEHQQSAKPVWHIPTAVYTVLDSWWWTEYLSETCRVLLQK